jgi:hypothetical protein
MAIEFENKVKHQVHENAIMRKILIYAEKKGIYNPLIKYLNRESYFPEKKFH